MMGIRQLCLVGKGWAGEQEVMDTDRGWERDRKHKV